MAHALHNLPTAPPNPPQAIYMDGKNAKRADGSVLALRKLGECALAMKLWGQNPALCAR